MFAILTSTIPGDFPNISRKHARSSPHVRVIAATLEGLLHFEFGDGDEAAQERARTLSTTLELGPLSNF